MNLRNFAIWGVIILGALTLFMAFGGGGNTPMPGQKAAPRPEPITYSQLVAYRNGNQIAGVEVKGEMMTGKLKDGKTFTTTTTLPNSDLIESIQATVIHCRAR